jgi:hypothetical protein
MRTLNTLLWLALLLLPWHAIAATELEDRARIEAATSQDFALGNFQRLEVDAKSYRTEKSRTSSGLWKLTLFYSGIAEALEIRGDPKTPDANFADLEKKVNAWTRQFPDSPTANIARSMLLFNRGWAYRGNGFSSQVRPESWAPFRKYVAEARAHLERTKATSANDPKWYELMVSIARSEGWVRKDFDKLLDEAFDREPLFYQTYFLALEYLLPKWHGDVEAIEAFAEAAVRRTAQHEGRGMYARIYWFASQTQFGNGLFSKSLAVWPRMRDGFDDVIARYPDAWNLNNYAKFACLAGDKKKASELILRTESEIVPEAWSPPALRESCRVWAARR